MFSSCPKQGTISGTANNIITKKSSSNWDCSVFTSKWIKSTTSDMIYKFTVQIRKKKGIIATGFVTNKHKCNTSRHIKQNHSYIYDTLDYIYANGNAQSRCGITCKQDDKITFIINFKNSSISIDKNDGEITKCLFGNITIASDISYKFAVSLYCPGDSVMVTSGHQINNV